MDIYEKALALHKEHHGKMEINVKVPMETMEDLSMAYTPGVAQPCREIHNNPETVYDYTWKGNSVAVVSDGTAVLGLGDIGPAAGLPVMEGKSILFKKYANIDAVPICIDTKDPQEIIKFCKQIAPTFGGINLEDISAPRCVEIERTLKKELDIPVFHDDQHGTAIVVTAALVNALKVVGKKPEDVTVVVSGTGAAGSSIIHMIHDLGVKEIYGFNINGIVIKDDYDKYDFLTQELTEITNKSNKVTNLTKDQLAKIYTGQITNWKDLGGQDEAIVVIGREAGSGTRGAFEELLGIEEQCQYAQELNETGAVLAKVAKTSGSIGYVSLDVLDDTVSPLQLDGVEPSEKTVKDGSYALQRPFVMATNGKISEQSKQVQAVFDFINSDDGQKIIEKVGLVTPNK